VRVPRSLLRSAGRPDTDAWLERLPTLIDAARARWSLDVGTPFDGREVSCAWVAPVRRRDGSGAVLKIGMQHMEARDEIAGLRAWQGQGTTRLLEAHQAENAMLLERCEPGHHLRELPESEQDAVVAGLLRRLWRQPAHAAPFRPLRELIRHWCAGAESRRQDAPREESADDGLVAAGLAMARELADSPTTVVLLHTDLHAGNVLRAEREPWLVIDPKPFCGDPAYDATQHLLNCSDRLAADAVGTVHRFAELVQLDPDRVARWVFARCAAGPAFAWHEEPFPAIARALAP
jgi:streptomycin 6-kinase